MAKEKLKLADAYVQIIPSAKGIKGKITEQLGGEADSAGKSAGLSIASAVKGAIAAAGIGAVLKESISEGANLQQSIGGIETLFKESADKVLENARMAYKTAGMSANAYMESVTSFSASLLQGLAGDTGKAAEVADMALTDMSDNANKMGTSMDLIQNAYQGFAKQNYTMLDNLKLGYGGTKTEMQRLLADAQKLSGVKYDIGNLSDVYEAIHVIQEDLGITGTTAKEAASTFSGSLASMKAAASDLLGHLSLGEDIKPYISALMESTSVFVIDNLIPMTLNIVTGIGTALITADWASILQNLLTKICSSLGTLAAEVLGVDTSITDALSESVFNGVPVVFGAISDAFTEIWTMCQEVWDSVGQPVLDMILEAFNFLLDNWDSISTAIKETFQMLWDVVRVLWTELGVPVFESINKLLAIVRDAFAERMPAIKEFVGSCFSDIKIFWESNLKPCLEAIGAFIKDVLAPAFEIVFKDFIGPIIDTTFQYIKNIWEYTLKPVFIGITDFLTGIFTLNFEKAWEGIELIFKGVINRILSFIENFINGSINAINGLISGIAFLGEKVGELLGFEISVSYIDTVSVPKLAKGGILEKGQMGLLEGSGAEAVVPLENNSKWIARVAEDLGVAIGNDDVLIKILEVLIAIQDEFPEKVAEIISQMKFQIGNREFARLVKAVS